MILVTGTSGALGSRIYERLRSAGADVVAGTRRPASTSVRRLDFDDAGSLPGALAGVDVLMMVSAGYAEDDVVIARHRAAVAAAVAAGVRHVVYTSLATSCDRMTIALAHRVTEAALAHAPLQVTVLRNGLYAEVPAGLAIAGARSAADTGVFAAAWGDGRVPVVARDDLAEAAATVAAEADDDLTAGRSRHAGRTYELEAVESIGAAEIAAILSESLGRPVRYERTRLATIRAALAAGPLEDYQVGHTISMFATIGSGLLEVRPGDLPALLGRGLSPVGDLVRAAVAAGGYRSRSLASP